MTFCILAFASDGWVMAADRREQNQLGGTWHGTRLLDSAMKICWNEKAGVACCFSGDIIARKIAEGIVTAIRRKTLDFDNLRHADERGEVLKTTANDIFREVKTDWGDKLGAFERTVLVVLATGEVWRLAGWDGMGAQRIDYKKGAICIGDAPNPAAYLTQRFYPASTDLKTVDELMFLIGHCVLEAGALNPTGVEGLDLLTYRTQPSAGFHLLDDLELKSLKKRSAETFQKISRLLFSS